MNWSEKDLDRKMLHILKRPSYGKETIRIDDFFSDEQTFTMAEAKKYANVLLNQAIQRAKAILSFEYPGKSLKHLFLDFFKIKETDLLYAVAEEVNKEFDFERLRYWDDLREEEIEKQREIVRKRKHIIQGLSRSQKMQLAKYLAEKEIIDTNAGVSIALMADHLHIFADKLTDEEINQLKKQSKKDTVK